MQESLESKLFKIKLGIEVFSKAKRERMFEKCKDGYIGWNDPDWLKENWEKEFNRHITKAKLDGYSQKSMVDLSNFCMMIFNLKN